MIKIVMFFLLIISINTDDLIIKKVFNNKIQILLPKDFRLMKSDELELKYPSESRPTEVYTNEDLSVNIGFNHTNNKVTSLQLKSILSTFTTQFERIYPTAKWSKKELQDINGRDFIVLEFETPALDTDVYNLMFITSLNDRLLICSFNCTSSQKDFWQSRANRMMNSIRIR